MNGFNRLLAIVLALALVVCGAFLLASVGGLLPAEYLARAPDLARFASSLRELPPREEMWLPTGATIGLALGVLLLWLELRTPRSGKDMVIQRDKLGGVSVSLPGLRRLAEHVIGEIPGVEAITSEAWPARDGVAFRCRVLVTPEASVPELSEEIRRRLGDAATHHLGRPVTGIDIRTRVGSLNGKRRLQ